VNRKTFITALGCALLATTLLGCGGSNKLQSITLGIDGNSGLFNVAGIGGTLQLKATGNYSSTKTHDLTNVVTYSVVPDGDYVIDDGAGNVQFFPLPSPPMTVTMSPTGLMTAVDPFVCTWQNLQPDPTKPPSWVLAGSYKVTATFQGITSQPVFVGVASAAGPPPTGACGPS
jgi:hypothetical protein